MVWIVTIMTDSKDDDDATSPLLPVVGLEVSTKTLGDILKKVIITAYQTMQHYPTVVDSFLRFYRTIIEKEVVWNGSRNLNFNYGIVCYDQKTDSYDCIIYYFLVFYLIHFNNWHPTTSLCTEDQRKECKEYLVATEAFRKHIKEIKYSPILQTITYKQGNEVTSGSVCDYKYVIAHSRHQPVDGASYCMTYLTRNYNNSVQNVLRYNMKFVTVIENFQSIESQNCNESYVNKKKSVTKILLANLCGYTKDYIENAINAYTATETAIKKKKRKVGIGELNEYQNRINHMNAEIISLKKEIQELLCSQDTLNMTVNELTESLNNQIQKLQSSNVSLQLENSTLLEKLKTTVSTSPMNIQVPRTTVDIEVSHTDVKRDIAVIDDDFIDISSTSSSSHTENVLLGNKTQRRNDNQILPKLNNEVIDVDVERVSPECTTGSVNKFPRKGVIVSEIFNAVNIFTVNIALLETNKFKVHDLKIDDIQRSNILYKNSEYIITKDELLRNLDNTSWISNSILDFVLCW